jgi:hypothetical protein
MGSLIKEKKSKNQILKKMRVKSGQLGGIVFFRRGSGKQAGCPTQRAATVLIVNGSCCFFCGTNEDNQVIRIVEITLSHSPTPSSATRPDSPTRNTE